MRDDQADLNSIFLAALQVDEAGRAEFLEQACGQDPQLLRQIEEMLEAHHRAGGDADSPGSGFDQTIDMDSSDAMAIAETGHSVLKALRKNLPTFIPQVILRDLDGDDPIVRPKSTEVPTDHQDSRYQLHGEIARGGMGAIIKARDTDLGRDLVLKVLLDAHRERPEVVERFIEEAQIAGQLQHPGIVPVYALGQLVDRRPFFSMKLVKGQTLAFRLAERANARQDQAKLLGVFEQICQTVAYAHSRGVIHRDLKPSNIMVGAFGEVQVMDWGLAKVLAEGGVADEQKATEKHQDVSIIRTRRSTGSDTPLGSGQTQIGSIMGTPAYMPPEQALGEVDRLDERADVFGLGSILSEILTGKPPYVGENTTQVFRQASRGKLDDCFVRLDASGADQELIELAKRMLAPEPEDRLRNAGVVADCISSYLQSVRQRVQQAELASAEANARAREAHRRRQLHVAIAALMLIVAALSAVFAARYRQQSRLQKTLASKAEHLAREAEGARDAEQQKNDQLQNLLRVSTVNHLAAQSAKLREESPVQSVLLALEAIETTRRHNHTVLPIAREALLNTSHIIGGLPLVGHKGEVESLAISPDGRWLVTGAADATARIWNLDAEDPTADSLVLTGHQSRIRRVAISPDSRWLATGDRDGDIHLCQLGEKLTTAVKLRVNGRLLWSLAFSPDSRHLASGCDDGTVQLWNLTTPNATTSRLLPGHTSRVNAVRFSPDGRWLAACGGRSDNAVRLWQTDSLDSGSAAIVLPHGSAIHDAAFSPNGRWLATGCGNGIARLWDLQAADVAEAPIQLLGQTGVNSLAISSSGRWLVTAGSDANARLWDLEGDFPPASPIALRGHQEEINAIAIKQDNSWLATGSSDNTVRLWNLNAADPADSSIVLRAHSTSVKELAFSPDGRWLASEANDATPRLWDVGSNDPEPMPLILQARPTRPLALSTDGRRLVTGGPSGRTRIWELGDEGPSAQLSLQGPRRWVRAAAISPDGRRLVTAGFDRTARLWDLTAADPGDAPILLRHRQSVRSLAIGPSNRWLASACVDGAVYLWQLGSDEPAQDRILLKGHQKPIWPAPVFSPNGRWLATGSADGSARRWDLHDKDPASTMVVFAHQQDRPVPSLAISPDSRWLATASYDHERPAAIWDFTAPDPAASPRVLNHESNVFAVTISPNGRWVATASWDKTAKVWDLSAPDPAVAPIHLKGHVERVYSVAFSGDSRWVATGSSDNTARLWDLGAADPTSSPIVLRGHAKRIRFVYISPDGRWLITGGDDDNVRFWDLDLDSLIARQKRLAGRQLTPEERQRFLVQNAE